MEEIINTIEDWINNTPDGKFCIHNGFAGFSFGCPSNPIFIDSNYAKKYIERIIEIEKKSLQELIYINSINIEKLFPDFPELQKIGYRFIGLVRESECLYGDAGLG